MATPPAIRGPGGHELPTRPCRRCQVLIFFAPGPNGKLIPLDARAPTFILAAVDGQLVAVRAEAYVSHFASCPHASEFSGGRAAP